MWIRERCKWQLLVEEAGWSEREGKGWNTALDACNQKVRGERALKRKVVGKKKQEINSCTMKVEKKRGLKRERES